MGIPALSPTMPWRGNLTFPAECRPSRDVARGPKHDFTIHEDWSMSSPARDWEPEKVTVARGGYCSCLGSMQAVHRVRFELPTILREERPPIRHDKPGHWRLNEGRALSCCERSGLRSIRSAVAHVTSAQHIAMRRRLPNYQVVILRHVLNASRPDVSDAVPAARHVREQDGLAHLWAAGIRPEEVEEIGRRVAFVSESLPGWFFERLGNGIPRQNWLVPLLPTLQQGACTAQDILESTERRRFA